MNNCNKSAVTFIHISPKFAISVCVSYMLYWYLIFRDCLADASLDITLSLKCKNRGVGLCNTIVSSSVKYEFPNTHRCPDTVNIPSPGSMKNDPCLTKMGNWL